jgi:hypothetical protein
MSNLGISNLGMSPPGIARWHEPPGMKEAT